MSGDFFGLEAIVAFHASRVENRADKIIDGPLINKTQIEAIDNLQFKLDKLFENLKSLAESNSYKSKITFPHFIRFTTPQPI